MTRRSASAGILTIAAAMLFGTGCCHTDGGGGGGAMAGGVPGMMSGRALTIYQMKSAGLTDSFPLDLSQLPPDAIQKQGSQGGSRYMILLKQGYPVKIMVVPATQP